MAIKMKIYVLLFFFKIFAVAMSPQRTESQMLNKLSVRTKKTFSKFHRGAGKEIKSTFVPSSEREQNSVLESMSPEYKYEDNEEKTDQSNLKISNLLDEKTIQDLASKNLLDSERQQSTRAYPALSLLKELRPATANKHGVESLEQFNILLQNTSPEYQYDRAERGPGFSYDSCVDLDPDCWKYEMHGLCSDSPDLAEKRYNCKKTCHLCVSSTHSRSYTKKASKKL